MFKVIIIGGEKTGDYSFFKEKCIFYLKEKGKSGDGITIYSIGDEFINRFATKYGIDIQYFFTDWKKDGKNAIAKRNELMLSSANALIAFDDNTSEMRFLISEAKKKKILVRVVKKET